MALPKKGRRSIIVNGKTYYYKISTKHFKDTVRLTIEDPEARVLQSFVSQKGEAITPKVVMLLILKNFKMEKHTHDRQSNNQ